MFIFTCKASSYAQNTERLSDITLVSGPVLGIIFSPCPKVQVFILTKNNLYIYGIGGAHLRNHCPIQGHKSPYVFFF